MVQFKALILAIQVIITLNSFSGQQKKSHSDLENKIVENRMNDNDTIVISKSQYKILINKMGTLKIEVTDMTLVAKIVKDISPIFKLELENSYIVAKGNDIFSSSEPKECDYFYPFDNDKKVIMYEKKIIDFSRIHKERLSKKF
jgi:hypothetical protein